MTLGTNFAYLRSQERHYIQPVDVDAEFQRLLAELEADQPQWTADVSDPAYRQLKMNARIKADIVDFANGLMRSSSPLHAVGDAVDELAALQRLIRRPGESDERLLRRTLIEPRARGNIGSTPFIQSAAYAADDAVSDVQVKGRGDGWQVDVWIMSSEAPATGQNRGVPSSALVARVGDYINDEFRIITGHRNIATAATVTTYTVAAALTYDSDQYDATGVIERARERVYEYVRASYEIGSGISTGQIVAALYGVDRDVASVALTAPATSLAATDGTAYLCEPNDTDVTITATAV